MGINRMQGVSAHIEYIKKDYDKVDFVNCKFWKNEICYNTLSTKYGESCYTKRGCMYSIPLPAGSKKKAKKEDKQNGKNSSIPSIIYTYKVSDIKNNYFQIKLNEVVANEGAYIAYDASEKLKEDLELNPSGMTIRFFENVEIRANASSITIKVGKKEFKFTATGLTNN